MDFSYYIRFFHDGGLNNVEYQGDKLILYINSREIPLEDNRDSIQLDNQGLMQGRLIVVKVSSILLSKKPLAHRLTKGECEGEILDFDIKNNRIYFGIMPFLSARKSKQERFFTLEITGQTIIWDDLCNQVQIDLTYFGLEH